MPARTTLLAFIASIFVFSVSSALAQSESAPPDIVRLRNGGMVRGTIVEALPGTPVRIQLADGTERTFAAEDVEYVGPAAEMAPRGTTTVEPMAAEAPPARGVPVRSTVNARFASEQDGLVLHRVAASVYNIHAFTLVCRLPCTTELEPGAYQFGATTSDGEPSATSQVVQIDQDGLWNVRFTDNSGLRVAGWVTLAVGGLVAILAPVMALALPTYSTSRFTGSRVASLNTPLMLGLLAPGGVALFVGMFLALFSYDGVEVDPSGIHF